MNIRHTSILAVSISLLLSGCTTNRDERRLDRLTRYRDWPRIQQIATAEVKKREKIWPDNAAYLPMQHQDKVWSVTAMTGTPNGDVQRTVILMIGDDGGVLAYQRYWQGHEVPEWHEDLHRK